MPSRADEVTFGEGQETRVLGRWLRARAGTSRSGGLRAIKSKQFQDWDFLVLDSAGLPYAYVEIKVRRQPLSRFRDAIAPVRKHEMARKLHLRHGIDFVMVVEYPDALVEVDLASSPDEVSELKRRDRSSGQLHAFWRGDQLKVIG